MTVPAVVLWVAALGLAMWFGTLVLILVASSRHRLVSWMVKANAAAIGFTVIALSLAIALTSLGIGAIVPVILIAPGIVLALIVLVLVFRRGPAPPST
jgi:hypothetical protein